MVRSHGLLRLAARPLHLRQHVLGRQTIFSSAQRNSMRVLGIETSADDTCVACMTLKNMPDEGDFGVIHGIDKVTYANQKHMGIHPVEAVVSHTQNLSRMVSSVMEKSAVAKPDLICVTRGPGMGGCLSVGVTTAKTLSDVWNVPIVGVHHMQAHALTPAMENALQYADAGKLTYPFLTLLVSGKHTMLVHTKSPVNHRILAKTHTNALGDVLDKVARELVPSSWKENLPVSGACCYPQLMEERSQAFFLGYSAPQTRQQEIEVYQSEHGWELRPPLRETKEMRYDFTSLHNDSLKILHARPEMSDRERRELAGQCMRLAFEHLMSRVIKALETDVDLIRNPPKTLVLSGGVARNLFLRQVVKETLVTRGFSDIKLHVPRRKNCEDNAAMIAYAGWKMYTNGWETDKSFCPIPKWSIEEILSGVDCWNRRSGFSPITPENAQSEVPEPSPANDETSSQDTLVMAQDSLPSSSEQDEAFPGAALFFPNNPSPSGSEDAIDETLEQPGERLGADINIPLNPSGKAVIDKPLEIPRDKMDEADLQLERILRQAESILDKWDSGFHDTSTSENLQAARGAEKARTPAAQANTPKREVSTLPADHNKPTNRKGSPTQGRGAGAGDKVNAKASDKNHICKSQRQHQDQSASVKDDGASKAKRTTSARDQASPRAADATASIPTIEESESTNMSQRTRSASQRTALKQVSAQIAAQIAERDDAVAKKSPAKATVQVASTQAPRPVQSPQVTAQTDALKIFQAQPKKTDPKKTDAATKSTPETAVTAKQAAAASITQKSTVAAAPHAPHSSPRHQAGKVWPHKPPPVERHDLKIRYVGFADEPVPSAQKQAPTFIGRMATMFGLGRK